MQAAVTSCAYIPLHALGVVWHLIFAIISTIRKKNSSRKLNIPQKLELAKIYSTGEKIHTDITQRIFLLQFIERSLSFRNEIME